VTAEDLLGLGPVLPLAGVTHRHRAVPLAEALLEGGLRTVEVVLRTSAALPAIRAIAEEVPEITVGAGTVRSAADVECACEAGAAFLVSPGQTPALLDAMTASSLPFLAGCASPSDVLALRERGVGAAKLFPASAIDAMALAKALAGPFPEMRLCPTGGLGPKGARALLELPNVPCVGGSWIAAGSADSAEDLRGIVARARAASALTLGVV
jgi:2-dehydro-3-deoxyphosphogluconate aldolase / (4S)-4-hydroxy-2-oxoglutarate aldolase